MKTPVAKNNFPLMLLFLFVFACCMSRSGQQEALANAVSYPDQLATMDFTSDSLMVNIQQKIDQAFAQGLVANSTSALDNMVKQLDDLYATKKQNLVLYWKAYARFYQAIAAVDGAQANGNLSEERIDNAIDILEAMKNKNAEDYALLARARSYSTQFSPQQAPFIAQAVKEAGNLSIRMDSTNLRGYYALAESDFYTPAQFGGGTKAEGYLLKAISLPDQRVQSPYLPSWGKEDAYTLLVQHYIRRENWESAKKYFQQGITLFPQSHRLSQLAVKLVGK